MAQTTPSQPQPEHVPPMGTMAYAQYLRKKELSEAKNPGNQETGKPVRQPVSQEASKLASQPDTQAVAQEESRPTSQPASKQAGNPTSQQVVPDDGAQAHVLTKRLKRIAEDDPRRKTTFLLSNDEEEILEELKLRMRRELRLSATKNDILRAAVRLIGRDFAKNPKSSFLASNLGRR